MQKNNKRPNHSRSGYSLLPGFVRFCRRDSGLTVTEYAVAAGLIAATLTVTFGNLGLTIDAIILAVIAFM